MVKIKRQLQMACAVITFSCRILASQMAAQIPSPPPEIAIGAARVEHYPATQVTFPNGVKGIPNLVYWQPLGYRPLTLDIYLPPAGIPRPPTGFPLIVHIHGGGWMVGDSRLGGPFVDFPGVLASLAARGYVVASINYRLSSEAAFPAQIQDVKAAIRWLRSRAAEYGIDPARAMTWGESAGGHLAGLAAVSCGAQALEPVQAIKIALPNAPGDVAATSHMISDCVQGAIPWYGVFDIATIAAQAKQDKAMSRDLPGAPEWKLLGCFASECKKGQIAAASPVTYVDAKSPPMLLIVGSEDKTVPYHQTLEMADKLKAAGAAPEVMVIPGVHHGFVGKTLEETRDANLKALDATLRFIDKTMKNDAPVSERPRP
jgi:acetyl esterase/lipase